MTDQEKNNYLEFAKGLAYEAGEIMKKYFRNSAEFKIKDDQTIVTVADEEINQMVIDKVAEIYPDHSVDGEEASSLNLNSKYVWVCDPIDGTALFNADMPMSVFSLALVEDGEPIVGVVYDPWQDRIYTAIKGQGAFMNGLPVKVSDKDLKNKSLSSYDWWGGAEYDVVQSVYKLGKDNGTYFISVGSTTHAAMLVASGKMCVSIFPGTKGKNVDIAAAKVIVEEAGGKVTDLFGKEQRYDQAIKGAIVSNGVVHDEVVKAVLKFNEEK